MERVASLIPSATEIAAALGFERALVGRSHECDFPAAIASLPVLTEPKLNTEASSARIDADVKALVRDGLSVYRVDTARLRELDPTLILTQDQCEVCAASLKDVEGALSEWLDGAPVVVSLHPRRLGDVWRDVERVGTALGDADRGRELASRLEGRVAEIAERAVRIRSRPRVACIEWIEPLMAAGHWMPELVTLAGGENLLGETGEQSPWLDWETLRAADPDVVVVLPCGFDLERTRREAHALAGLPGWAELRAIRAGRVVVTDGHQYFNRPGPRLVDSLEIMAEILHPDEFAPRHRGDAWDLLRA